MRSGLTNLVDEFRALVNESGTAIFTDDSIETILDRTKVTLFASPLFYVPEKEASQTVYKNYYLPSGGYLEGTASGTALVRVTDSNGTVVSNYVLESDQARFTFDANTGGTLYYFTGNQFDLNKAVSEGWKQKASTVASNFDFSLEGRSYKKSQVIQGYLTMAKHYETLAKPMYGDIYRSDQQ